MNRFINTIYSFLALLLLLCGCKSGTTMQVRGSFNDIWLASQLVATNQDFKIISDDVPDLRIGKKWGLLEGRRSAPNVSTKIGGKEILSRREPWEQIRIAVSPIEPREETLIRKVKLTVSTEETNLLLLHGKTKILPEIQAEVLALLIQHFDEDPQLSVED